MKILRITLNCGVVAFAVLISGVGLPQDNMDAVRSLVVRLRIHRVGQTDETAAGLFVGKDQQTAYFITAYHAIRASGEGTPPSIQLQFYSSPQNFTALALENYDEALDLAVVSTAVSNLPLNLPELTRTDPTVVPITIVGHPAGLAWTAWPGKVENENAGVTDIRHFITNRDDGLAGGFSGGPVIDSTGAFLGMHTSSDRRYGFAAKSADIVSQLRAWRVPRNNLIEPVGRHYNVRGPEARIDLEASSTTQSNGFSDPSRRTADQKVFEEVEHIAPDGLGPLYNAQSCRECHQTPVSGGASQVTELRVGHLDAHGLFQNPEIPINHGAEIIRDRTLVNNSAICPEIQEHVPKTETIRTTRVVTSTLGDGYVEAIPDETLLRIRREQCRASHGKICGQAVKVPVPESEGVDRIGRFGWKDQHASLLAFAADAYLNEMGITNSLHKTEVTSICNPAQITEPNSLPDPNDNNLEDIDHFASFMRSLKVPARDETAAATLDAKRGEELFAKIGCATCHVETIVTGKSPASPAGPGLHPEALENRTIHPYSDFLLHDVGTGDGIAAALIEHFGRQQVEKHFRQESEAEETKAVTGNTEDECSESYQTAVAEGQKHPKLLRDTLCARHKIRTAPLWGLRLRSRLMHDGNSVELNDAIRRHRGEAGNVSEEFFKLRPADQKAVLAFLESL